LNEIFVSSEAACRTGVWGGRRGGRGGGVVGVGGGEVCWCVLVAGSLTNIFCIRRLHAKGKKRHVLVVGESGSARSGRWIEPVGAGNQQ